MTSSEKEWDVAMFMNMNEVETISPLVKVKLDKSILISLPYFHTHRNPKGVIFKNVICPHWVRDVWYSRDCGKDIPRNMKLSRSGMRFLAAHGQQIWLACTKDYYEASGNWRNVTVPLVRLVDPAGYYLKAHYLFKERSPYAGAVNPLPLRYPLGDDSVGWFITRAVTCVLFDLSNGTVAERAVLNNRGKDVVEFMLEVDLDFRWALFLTNIRTLINPQPQFPDDEERVQELFDLCIPLAIVMSKQDSVMRPRGKGFHENRRVSDVEHYLKVGNIAQARLYGDAWIDAQCLSLHLGNELAKTPFDLRWMISIPGNLASRVKRARNLPQVIGAQAENSTPLRTHDTIFKARGESEIVFGDFNTLLYGSAINNLALVKQAYEDVDADGNTPGGIGIATDIDSGKEVLLSRESLLDLSTSSQEIEEGLIFVTYNRLHQIKSRGADDDGENGPSLMISGLSALNKAWLSDSFRHLTSIPSDHTGSFRDYIAYPYYE